MTPRRAWTPPLLVALVLVVAAAAPRVIAQPVQTEVTFPNGSLQLHGFIWKPDAARPFPALLWNHGSEKLPGWLPSLGPAFVRQGYVFLVPHRRGQGRSPGLYIQDQLQQARREERSRLLVQLHELQLTDQLAALTYLKGQPFVDAGRLAVAGCSYGGIQTVLAAEGGHGYRAAVDFAGGAQSWQGSPDLRARMLRAVRGAAIPVFFVQAENDYDLTPSRALSAEMQRAGKSHQVKVYPRFGSGPQDAHDFCVKGLEVWGPDVFPYLASNLR